MNQRHEPLTPVRITAISIADAARILATAYRRRIAAEDVRAVVDAGELARSDDTFSLIDYTAFLVSEVVRG